MSEAAGWLSVSLPVEGAEAMARVEAIFERFGAQAVCLDEPGEALLEPAPGAMPLAASMRLSGLFPGDFDPQPLAAALAAAVPGAAPPRIERIAESWREALTQRPEPLRIGGLEILPELDAAARDSGVRARVLLAPGLGFGTGRHPTTALCLEALGERDLAGRRVLDYGCGSGILAIAALKLGARGAVAVDHDPQAMLATRDNARRNRVASRLEVLPPERLRPRRPFDLVLANILASTLIGLAPRLVALLSREGELILSGMLAGQEEEVARAYAPDLDVAQRCERDGWVGLILRRGAGR